MIAAERGRVPTLRHSTLPPIRVDDTHKIEIVQQPRNRVNKSDLDQFVAIPTMQLAPATEK